MVWLANEFGGRNDYPVASALAWGSRPEDIAPVAVDVTEQYAMHASNTHLLRQDFLLQNADLEKAKQSHDSEIMEVTYAQLPDSGTEGPVCQNRIGSWPPKKTRVIFS